MSGVMKFGIGCTSGMSWGLGAFMGNLEQAAVHIFHQEEEHELSFNSSDSKRPKEGTYSPFRNFEPKLAIRRGQTQMAKRSPRSPMMTQNDAT